MSDWIDDNANFAYTLQAVPKTPCPDELKTLAISTAMRLRQDVEQGLVHMLPSHSQSTVPMHYPFTVLNLATSVFMFNGRLRIINAPYHILHRYFGFESKVNLNLKTADQGWEYDKISATISMKIISLCGLDSSLCTHTELEELDPYVVCLTCASESNRLPTMKWDQAVSLPLLIHFLLS